MENSETLLTNELYKLIMENLANEMSNLKQEQSDTLNDLSIKIERLKLLKCQLIELKKTIKYI